MFPTSRCWSRWLYIDRKWSGKIVHIGIRQWALILDFRKDWLAEFLGENAGGMASPGEEPPAN